jgi:NADH-quinone oxidoreductase subunit F
MSDSPPDKPLTGDIRADRQALSLKEYQATGGYETLKNVLANMDSNAILDVLKDAGVKGRGGGGFPLGMKWIFVPLHDDVFLPRYFVVNADEMEPGTFKDRLLMEGNPHLLVESVLIAAYTIKASVSYIFLRNEYREVAKRMNRAIEEARDAGFVGKNIQGSGFDVEIYLHSSAGRYICGEETGLINALEGRRPVPRNKPPFPQVSGAWGHPTVINNVETVCNVTPILRYGADWFKDLSLTDDPGTKLYGASGFVRNNGPWELPMGTTVGDLLENHAGMKDGYEFKGACPGGASTNFITKDHMDTPMDFPSMGKAGSRLGTGAMIVLDHKTCVVGMLKNMEHFFAQESCGWCTPCRDGLPWLERLLGDFCTGHATEQHMEILEQHIPLLGPGKTFCAHAPGAMMPLSSAIQYFRDDFNRHVSEGRCPWGSH